MEVEERRIKETSYEILDRLKKVRKNAREINKFKSTKLGKEGGRRKSEG